MTQYMDDPRADSRYIYEPRHYATAPIEGAGVFEDGPHDYAGMAAYPVMREASYAQSASSLGKYSQPMTRAEVMARNQSMMSAQEESMLNLRMQGPDEISALPPPARTPSRQMAKTGSSMQQLQLNGASASDVRVNSLATEVQLLRGSVSQMLMEREARDARLDAPIDVMGQELAAVMERMFHIEQVRCSAAAQTAPHALAPRLASPRSTLLSRLAPLLSRRAWSNPS